MMRYWVSFLLLLLVGTGVLLWYPSYRDRQGEPVITIERQASSQSGYDLITRVERGDVPCPYAKGEHDGEIFFACITEDSIHAYSELARENPRIGENDWKYSYYSYQADVTAEMPQGISVDYYDANGDTLTEEQCRSDLGETFLSVHQAEEHMNVFGNLGGKGGSLERWVFFTPNGEPVCQMLTGGTLISEAEDEYRTSFVSLRADPAYTLSERGVRVWERGAV